MFLRVNGTLCKCRISLYFVFADKNSIPGSLPQKGDDGKAGDGAE